MSMRPPNILGRSTMNIFRGCFFKAEDNETGCENFCSPTVTSVASIDQDLVVVKPTIASDSSCGDNPAIFALLDMNEYISCGNSDGTYEIAVHFVENSFDRKRSIDLKETKSEMQQKNQ
jgi:hypothetical protein